MSKRLLIFGILAVFGLTGCSALKNQSSSIPPSTNSRNTATSTPQQSEEKPAVAAHPVSLPALAEKNLNGSEFTVGNVLASNQSYTRYFVTYKSGALKISGIMNVPTGAGPYPVLILNHGYIDPSVYTNGRGLRREQDYLARHGYVVIHPDYRNHAQSDKDSDSDLKLRTGYIEDVSNLIDAIRREKLSYMDTERIGMLGHSMGGGVTMGVLVTKPNLVDAAVLFAPVSSHYADNFERWTRPDSRRKELAEKIMAAYGTLESNPEFWNNISPRNFFSTITAPVQIHHGTSDKDVPLSWSATTSTALIDAGKDIEFYEYPGEPHEFVDAWPRIMQRAVDFFDEHVKNS